MELSCPSCGTKHRTEDYPGAFEIPCACGYAILTPDESSAQTGSERAPAFGVRMPTAMEAQEQSFSINEPLPPIIDEQPEVVMTSAQSLTPSEQLPTGMVYDAFELPAASESTPTNNILAADSDFAPPEQETRAKEEISFPAPAQRTEREAPSLAQAVVQRSQSASLGQLLGPPYSVTVQGLDREGLIALRERARSLLKGRPWLEAELRRRGLDLDKLPASPAMKGVPEILAVEIYLASYELGGSCLFEALE